MNYPAAQSTRLQVVLLSLFLTTTPSLISSSISSSAVAQTSSTPQAPAESADAETQMKTTAEQFIDLLFAHRYSEALQYVHPTLREELVKGNNIVDNVQEFQEMTGDFKGRLDSRVESNLVLVNTEFESVTDTIVVIFDQQGQITGFDFPVERLRFTHRERILNK